MDFLEIISCKEICSSGEDWFAWLFFFFQSNELHEKQKFYLRQSVIDLQTKLQEMQMERDAMADIRLAFATQNYFKVWLCVA